MASGITHPFNRQLPPEVCRLIFEFAVGGKVREGTFFHPQQLKGWRLVNKSWNRYLTPLFYSNYAFHGSPNKIATLWRLLRLVATDPDKAAYVRQLTFTAMELDEQFNPLNAADVLFDIYRNVVDPWLNKAIADVSDLDVVRRQLNETYLAPDGRLKQEVRAQICTLHYRALYQKNRDWLDGVMNTIGFDQAGRLGEGMHQRAERLLLKSDPESGYQCPLVAIILAHCPKLNELNMQVWPSKDDPFLDLILGDATQRWPGQSLPLETRPLQQVRYLAIAPKPERTLVGKTTNDPFVIDDRRPYMRLPNLVEFTALHTETTKQILDTKTPTKITALAINGPNVDTLHLPKVLTTTPRLRHLTLSFTGDARILKSNASRPTYLEGPTLYTELWKTLSTLKDQLEYLDLHQCRMPYYDYRKWFSDRPDVIICPPLPEFTKLRQLSIALLLLTGYNCPHAADHTSLSAHLPPNLESLGLYTFGAGLLKKYMPEYDRALAELVSSSTSPHLRSVVLDDHTNPATTEAGLEDEHELYDEKLERAAARRGVTYRTDAARWLFYGGWETFFGQAAVRGRSESELVFKGGYRDNWSRWVIPRGLTVFGFKGKLYDHRKPAAAKTRRRRG
ncbi:hypothetical protein BJY00DRAFT_207706 [Aspergillus carlsbadensis]|nr:hypothetical protein BJY00DRAFT_207706 [Aspergillus carlsbadensis]